MNVLSLSFELIVGFFLLFLIIKFVGKKLINQITPFTFIAAIVLGELLGNAVYDNEVGLFYIFYAMSVWGLLLFLVEYIGQKSLFFRGVVEEKPSVLIKNGVINRQEMKRNKMNLNQLQSLLRQSETFSIREVAYCYLEANGSISILKKSNYQKTTREDLTLKIESVYVPVTLIRDGEVLWDELEDIQLNEQWLKQQLSLKGVQHYKDVFLAEWLEGEGLFVQTY
ncbi:DUF421 domain-containing protein [Metabacillus iocasae]|uniref:Uncharacterized membrane protein YcaP (DUF421 family) n=1 Tax=Priestia iocasae TaxID=2291674 RepID=A0ABS2QW43_9BACI|nr:DUF421 domain-containing protein [Metabacillus iocasae]MBM7703695.1 uncharacterized membrane protein YcaP (DUF421 family) [Metabacillus iocasae]